MKERKRFGFGLAISLCLFVPMLACESDDHGSVRDAGSADMAADTDGLDAGDQNPDAVGPACSSLFGAPNESTGLGAEQCRPTCGCGPEQWTAAELTSDRLAAFDAFSLTTPSSEILDDPYLDPGAHTLRPDARCAVLVEGTEYSLATYDSTEDAEAAGARVTHEGACGACSTLQDLGVYARNPDLTEPVRTCGLRALSQGDAATLDCLLELGFTRPCAQIWAFNTAHTRQACLEPCITGLNDPYNLPDGGTNACLRCDEEQSGPVFKAVAGRTRRNSGLPSALCRPCDSVARIDHRY